MISIETFFIFILLQAANPNQNVDFWTKQLNSESLDLQINALQKLAEIRDPSTVDEIKSALHSSNGEIRYFSAIALSKILSKESLEALAERFRMEKDAYVKAQIGRSMNSLKEYFEKKAAEKKPEPSEE